MYLAVCVPVLSCIVVGIFFMCAVCCHIESTQILLSHHPHLIDSCTCQDGPGFPLSSYQNQKFVYKKTISAKDNLKCCILAGEGGKPGNEATHTLRLCVNWYKRMWKWKHRVPHPVAWL